MFSAFLGVALTAGLDLNTQGAGAMLALAARELNDIPPAQGWSNAATAGSTC